MEAVNNSDRPAFLYIGSRKRSALVTSVRFLDSQTLVCCSLLGRRIYLISIDPTTGNSDVLDCAETEFSGQGTETDLCDANSENEVITSNFYKGSVTKYRREGVRILFVKDLDFRVEGFVHGVKFYQPQIISITNTNKKKGVYFFYEDQRETLLHIPLASKAQDVCFPSKTRVIVLTTLGNPRPNQHTMYRSDLMLFKIDVANGTQHLIRVASYVDCHFDCCIIHNGQLFVTDQFNNCVKIFDPDDLMQTGEIPGFDFPHGLDIQHDLMAVTNYGSNDIDIIPMKTLASHGPKMLMLMKFRYRTRSWIRRWKSRQQHRAYG